MFQTKSSIVVLTLVLVVLYLGWHTFASQQDHIQHLTQMVRSTSTGTFPQPPMQQVQAQMPMAQPISQPMFPPQSQPGQMTQQMIPPNIPQPDHMGARQSPFPPQENESLIPGGGVGIQEIHQPGDPTKPIPQSQAAATDAFGRALPSYM